MKNHYLLLGLLLATLSTHAQSGWQLFRPDVQYLYEYAANNSFESPLVGMKATADPCTEMYASLRFYDANGCNKIGPSFFGYEVCQTDNLTRLRVENDAFIDIRQTALSGEVWPAYIMGSDTIWATVSGIHLQSFLGLTDSVKQIAFYRQESGGVAEYVPADNRPMSISKHYGVVSTFGFRDFPYFLTESVSELMPLAGLSEPKVGFQNPSRADIFNLQVNDELHLVQTDLSGPYNAMGVYVGHKTLKRLHKATITAVETTTNPEAIKYYHTAQRLVIDSIGAPTSTYQVWPLPDISTNWLYNQENLAYLDLQPGAAIVTNPGDERIRTVVLKDSGLCGKTGKGLGLPLRPDGGCISWYGDLISHTFYLEGLGNSEQYFPVVGTGSHAQEIVYFRRDTFECGTPLDFDQITTTEEAPELLQITFSPNPTSGALLLQLPPDFVADLRLYDAYGRLVLSENQSQGNVEWNLGALPAGTYYVTIWQNGRLRKTEPVLKQ